MPAEHIPYALIPGELGIIPGSVLLVTADLTRLAMVSVRKEGGFEPGLLIDSLQHRLGKEGTLVIAAYNFNLEDGSHFDIKKSMPVTGSLAQAALNRHDFCRTSNALHSFLAWGKYANELCGLDNSSSFSAESPFAFLHEKNARMLLIDTGIKEAFTFVHYVEEVSGVPYRDFRDIRIKYTDRGGMTDRRVFRLYAKKPGWTMALKSLEELLTEKNVVESRVINGITFHLVGLQDAFPLIREDILHNRARNIASFSWKLFFRDRVKQLLSSAGIYRTVTDRIGHGTGF